MFQVISFNIRCANDPNGNSVAERAPRLKAITAPLNADLIGLQEMRPRWEPYIPEMYGDGYDMVNIYRAEKELESSPVLWAKDRYECLEVDRFWFSDTPEVESKGWDERYDCYRMCVHLKLREKASGRILHFLNTHFGFGDRGQVDSARLIAEFCRKFADEPICIVGDFNMTPDSPGYGEMVKHFTDVNAVTAKDWRTTYHGYDLTKPRDQHIDYCFVNDKIRPVSRKLIDDTIDGMFPSDHFGILMALEWKD